MFEAHTNGRFLLYHFILFIHCEVGGRTDRDDGLHAVLLGAGESEGLVRVVASPERCGRVK